MYIKTTYEQEFDDLMMYLKGKYPPKLFDLDGIGEQLDLSKFSKKFFASKITADASIDANANVDDVSVIAYHTELPKPIFRINSYYMLWKELKRLYGLGVANDIVENQLNGTIYINDFHGIGGALPYSYYAKTTIAVNDNGSILYSNMEDLFEHFSKKYYIEISTDKEVINLKNVKILDDGDRWVELKCILRHKSHTNLVKMETKDGHTTIVTTDHPVILDDGSEKLAKDITLQDNIKISKSKLPLSENVDIDLNYAYFVGFMIGDGWLNIQKGKTVDIRGASISIRQKDIKNTKIYSIVNDMFDNVRFIKDDTISFGYKKDVEKLLSTGIGSINRKLPIDILDWNKSSIKSLISGIIDSDGTVNNQNGIIDIHVISFTMVQQIAELLRALDCGKTRSSFAGVYNSKKSFTSDNDIFRVSIRLQDKDFIKLSEKISLHSNLVYKEARKDGRYETSQLLKIQAWETPEYVYDVTTETGQFHCQGMIQHNCYNYSTYDIMTKGLPMVKKINSAPPKYLYAFKSQLEQFTVLASNSTLGACGLADLLVVMSYYVKNILATHKDAHFSFANDKDCWAYVKENLVSFVYTINQPMRANQSPFTNISLYDKNFLNQLKDDYVFPDGSSVDVELVQQLQELFMGIMCEELERTPVTFPVQTACFSVDSDGNVLDIDFAHVIAKYNKKFGQINIYCGDSATLSSCCRLRSDKSNEYFNSFGSGSSKIGSLGVVTINLPRLAFKHKDNRDAFNAELTNLVTVCARINNAKRRLVQKRIDNGNHPLYSLGFIDINTQYSTVGINGFNECIEILGHDILTQEGQQLGLDIIQLINDENDRCSKQYKTAHNCEQIPAENVSIKLADKDRLLKFNDQYTIYSNQFIPLITKADMLDRIKLQGLFDKHFSGGAIAHINVDTEIDDENDIVELIKTCAKMGVVYWAINYNLQLCEDGHMSVGKGELCSVCGKAVIENYTRVVGFLTNVKNWHKVRREEDYPNRQFYGGL